MRRRSAIISSLLVAATTAGALTAASAHAVGGGSALDEKYRFVASIQTYERECTGALIDVEWIITTSSCFATNPDQGFPIPPGKPSIYTTVTVGSPDLGASTAQKRTITTLVPREHRDLVLAKLDEPVLDVPPVSVGTTAPSPGDQVTALGFGRTATEWVPGRLHAGEFSVDTLDDTTVSLTPVASDAAICKGDAGGPAVREADGRLELVGIHSASWQGGCFGESETRSGVVETRLDDIAGWLERSPVKQRMASDPTLEDEIGTPVGPEVVDWPYRYQEFERGEQRARLYWSDDTHETKFIRGAILDTYLRLGGHRELGAPYTDEISTADGAGSYNNLELNVCRSTATQASTADSSLGCNSFSTISHSPSTGAHHLEGSFYHRWEDLGREGGLGFPVGEQKETTDSTGKWGAYVEFRKNSHGAILYVGSDTRLCAVYGGIYIRWKEYGREKGGLGVPEIDVTATPDGVGRYVHFTRNASIYWTPTTGAWEVHGAIRQKWASMGWERSYLGYPISNEQAFEAGRRSWFQGGRIDYIARTGEVIAYRN
ncbi:LGFP repeat-containing protein [Amycolatopsis arida]|uniref:LGFP repeat-containing protein n=1 Tax=Amycolatopsis arida TaxID=587909 RepID=A0A1I5KX21_9PSEU|nr:trypsin-like serine protease [Amycolatopsis arida]TDX85869.1 LGFP repeat-containing protein [Amycolatopsis arida]SFO89605.1 LGFP repeat-containing protein [Amycolatopsis arida]